ncbi:prephenate dehydrogenase [candidate division KSB1 bacterium]|nr:prephenate dehydrogenase [candidate division KSB1 bacterium]MBL7092664.1 prephenate dehydrogenase [candidate division KSB1 bacterium]
MFFNKICIIGTGLIGGSLALAFRRKYIGEKIIGIDFPETIKKAVEHNIIDEGYTPDEIEQQVSDADLVILATNIQQIISDLKRIPPMLKKDAIVTDVGSSKETIIIIADQEFPDYINFVGGHPMAGSEKNGIDAADPFLFENCFYILTPQKNTPPDVLNKLVTIMELIGAKVLLLNASVHDKIAAAVSHLPQMLAVKLVNLIADYNQDEPNYLKLAAGGFRDMTRIASSPFSMWEDIFKTNSENILNIIDEFIVELNKLKDELSYTNLRCEFENAAKTRLSIPKDTKGFIHPNYDITVVVEDEPGVISKIASTLFEKGINIRDIEVLKVRLLEGGTMRLSFESEKNREAAIDLLTEKGFYCRKR